MNPPDFKPVEFLFKVNTEYLGDRLTVSTKNDKHCDILLFQFTSVLNLCTKYFDCLLSEKRS